MRVIGFDPGTNITGFGVLDNFNYLDSGIIDLRNISSIQKKLKEIYDNIFRLIEKFKPDSIALEDVFVAKNTKGTIKLGYVKGIIFLAAEHNSLNAYEYSPTTVKQSITGYGRSTKEEIRKMLPNLIANLKLNKFPDATDALAIAYCHIVHQNFYNFKQR